MQERRQNWRTREDEVVDAAISNAIRYLDSSSDYRECLPVANRHVPGEAKPSPGQGEFVTLDDVRTSCWIGIVIAALLASMIGLIMFLAFRS